MIKKDLGKTILTTTIKTLSIASILLFIINIWSNIQLNILYSYIFSQHFANCGTCLSDLEPTCKEINNSYSLHNIIRSNILIIIIALVLGIIIGVLLYYFSKEKKNKKNRIILKSITTFTAISSIILLVMFIATYNNNYSVECSKIINSNQDIRTEDLRFHYLSKYVIPFPTSLIIGSVYGIYKKRKKKN